MAGDGCDNVKADWDATHRGGLYDVVVILCGVNDIGDDETAASIYAHIEEMCEDAKADGAICIPPPKQRPFATAARLSGPS